MTTTQGTAHTLVTSRLTVKQLDLPSIIATQQIEIAENLNGEPTAIIAIIQVGPCVINHQRPVAWFRCIHSLYPTHVVYIYIYICLIFITVGVWKTQRMCKEHDYITRPSCVSAPQSNHVGSPLMQKRCRQRTQCLRLNHKYNFTIIIRIIFINFVPSATGKILKYY